ncbi:hypothetical protein MSG28_015970 [Choristoneura fumiferana]|uniref:Uncharacterized protein n=1 Tax=Choristoneura fumiferana TaxID=7141 RepID=A0ACC0K4Y0_CHOFU|nr:hypothetical protein MSG28_015970 [Choristoneura fumiferana]
MTAGVSARRKSRSRKSWAKVEQYGQVQASDFSDIGDWPTLGAAVAGPGARCHSTPPPCNEAETSHHNGNADQERKPLEEHHPRVERVDSSNNQNVPGDKHHQDRQNNDKAKAAGGGKGGNKSGKHKWVPLDIDVKAARPSKHGPPHAARPDNGKPPVQAPEFRGYAAVAGALRGRSLRARARRAQLALLILLFNRRPLNYIGSGGRLHYIQIQNVLPVQSANYFYRVSIISSKKAAGVSSNWSKKQLVQVANTVSLNGEDRRGSSRGRGATRGRGARRPAPRPASALPAPPQPHMFHHPEFHPDLAQLSNEYLAVICSLRAQRVPFANYIYNMIFGNCIVQRLQLQLAGEYPA